MFHHTLTGRGDAKARTGRGFLLGLVALQFLLGAQVGWAEETKSQIVVFDLTGENAETSGRRMWSALAESDEGKEIEQIVDSCSSTDGIIETCLVALRNSEEARGVDTRYISTREDQVKVYVFYRDDRPNPTVIYEETERSTRLSADLKTLFQIATRIRGLEREEDIGIRLHEETYTLARRRANLKIKVEQKAPPAQTGTTRGNQDLNQIAQALDRVAAALAGKSEAREVEDAQADLSPDLENGDDSSTGSDTGPEPVTTNANSKNANSNLPNQARELSLELITGPKEHWYLSANVVVNKVSELEFNDETNTLELKEKPSRFLLGLGYYFGDLAKEKSHGPSLKLLMEASSRPGDSLGLALGYRTQNLKRGGFELSAFSPFVGMLRVRNDEMMEGGMVRKGGKTDYEFVAGVSFNLDKALDWLKGDSSAD